MAVNAGTVYVDVKPDTSAMTGKSSGLAGAMKTAGVLAATAFAASFVKGGLSDIELADQTYAKLDKTLQSMGRNLNTDVLVNQANQLERVTGFGSEAIQDGQRLLSTFGNISDKLVKDLTPSVVDFAAQFTGGNMTSAATMLGKALDNPIKGLTALTRVGVTFTEQQTKQITKLTEAGKVAKAQAVIMDAVKPQIAGVGKASLTLSDQFTNAFGEIREAVMRFFLPAITTVMTAASEFFIALSEGDGTARTIAITVGVLAAALVAAKITLVAISAAQKVWLAITKVWTGITKAAAAAQWLWNAAMSANPIGLIIAAVVALVGVIVLLWNKNEAFRNFVLAAWDKIKTAVVAVWNAIKTAGLAVWNVLKGALSKWWSFAKAMFSAYKSVALAVWNAVKTAAMTVWNAIKAVVGKVVGAIKAYITGYKAVVLAVWDAIRSAAGAAWDWIAGKVQWWVDKVKGAIQGVKQVFSNIWSGALEAAKGAFNGIASAWNSTVGSISFSVPDWVPKIGGNSWSVPDIPMLAEGGIVTRPTLAVVGEAGPEAVVPLSRGGMSVRITDSNLGVVMYGVLEEDKRYSEQRGRAAR